MSATRRAFLHRLGAVGGTGAVFSAMHALGLAGSAAAAQSLTPRTGKGASVVILGAGIAGLVCAYELERAGFAVTVLEARDRVGGRNWTLRKGTRIEMVGEETQTVGFSDGVYMNAGPARIPSHHQGLLGYCKALGVPLEVEVNASRSAWFWDQKTMPFQMRQGLYDTRGHIAELLAKAVKAGALDQDLTPADKAALEPFLKAYGDLSGDMTFAGSDRSGLIAEPGAAGAMAEHRAPVPLRDLLANGQLRSTFFEDSLDMQATMFEPVGGMDAIPMAFERAITSPIRKNTVISRIRITDREARVAYTDRLTGEPGTIKADYAIITIPLALLAKIDTNFSKPVKAAIASVPNDFSNKIGFESPRFWEDQQIYGGISFVGGETNLIWYPSTGYHSPRGMLLACYGSGKAAETFAKRPLAEQIAIARSVVDGLHPGHGADLAAPAVVNWSKIPFNLGPWPRWPTPDGLGGGNEGRYDSPEYRLLNTPQGRAYLTGAHMSQTPGWQEGAILSARRTIGLITARAAAQAA